MKLPLLLLLSSCALTHGWARTTWPEGVKRPVGVCFLKEPVDATGRAERSDGIDDMECWSVQAVKRKLEEAPAPRDIDRSNEL